MKDNRCFICKYKQDLRPKTNDDIIYDATGKSVIVPLCYGHSVELFKTGQTAFIEKHKYIFKGNFGIEGDLDILSRFAERKASSWF